jgi:hypothetical protein
VEICDDLIDGVCIAEMLNHVSPERAKRAKEWVWTQRPRKRQRRPSDLAPFLSLIEAHIEAGSKVATACRVVGEITRQDPKRLANMLYAARRRRRRTV